MILLSFILLPLLSMILSLMIKKSGANKRAALFMASINFLWSLILVPVIQSEEILVVQISDWNKLLSSTLVADRFSIFMLLISSFLFFVITIYSTQAIKKSTRKNGFFGFAFAVLMGVNGAFLAGDIFILFIWLEVIVLSSLTLITLRGKPTKLKGTRKYLLLNLLSTFLMLSGISFIFYKAGTINIAALSQQVSQIQDLSPIALGLILILIGLFVKGALFPLYYWNTKSGKSSLPSVTALLAGLLTNVGIYILIRFYTLFLHHDLALWSQILLWLGGLSMVIGAIAASIQNNFRKILSFHIISQVGYTIIAMAFNTLAGLTAAIFFIAHNMLAKTNTFLVAGWIFKSRGTLNIKSLSNVIRQSRIWGFLFFVSAFTLAGLPPLSGFAGKYLVLKAGVDSNHVAISLVALFVGLITLFAMVKIWLEVFWKTASTKDISPTPPVKVKDQWMLSASIILAIAIVGMGVWAQPIINYCHSAAADILDPTKYVGYVLGI